MPFRPSRPRSRASPGEKKCYRRKQNNCGAVTTEGTTIWSMSVIYKSMLNVQAMVCITENIGWDHARGDGLTVSLQQHATANAHT